MQQEATHAMVSRRVRKRLVGLGYCPTWGNKYLTYIIKRFMQYMIKAVMHGYSIPLPCGSRFSLTYKVWKKVPRHLRRTALFPPKALGYTFHFMLTGMIVDRFGYYYKPEKEMKQQLLEHLNTDKVYHLID